MRAVMAAMIAAVLVLGCTSTSSVQPMPVRELDAGTCWYEVDRCHEVQISTGKVVDVCKPEWQARCREADLERYLRDGCTIVRLPDPTKVAVACGVPR